MYDPSMTDPMDRLQEHYARKLDQAREALEAAYSDLVGFEGYFERRRSMGTVASIRQTIDKVEAAIAACRT